MWQPLYGVGITPVNWVIIISMVIREIRSLYRDENAVAVEQRHGWLIPPEWEFVSEVWVSERNPVREAVYEHEGEVAIIK